MSDYDDNAFAIMISDLTDLVKRCKGATYLEAKKELADNVYPFLQNALEQINARFTEIETVLAEQLDPTESVVQPEFASQVTRVLAISERIAMTAEVMHLALADKLDDVTKKRISEILEGRTLPEWLAAFKTEGQALVEELQEITLEEGDDDDEDSDDEDGEEDSEDSEDEDDSDEEDSDSEDEDEEEAVEKKEETEE